MSSKCYYDESYNYFENWYGFLNEQEEVAGLAQQAAAEQERAEMEAKQREQKIMAIRQNAGPAFAELATLLLQLGEDGGDKGSEQADLHIRDMGSIMSDLAHREIGVEEFLKDINDELQQTGKSLQKIPK